MPRKKANEATVAPPPDSTVSPAVNKTRKKTATASATQVNTHSTATKPAAARRKAAPKSIAAEPSNASIASLAEAVHNPPALDTRSIEELAYHSWLERGCPMGSPDEDWYRAEQKLKSLSAAAGR
jgi:hypothetical protein